MGILLTPRGVNRWPRRGVATSALAVGLTSVIRGLSGGVQEITVALT